MFHTNMLKVTLFLFPSPFQKSKPTDGPQQFVELFVVVDNTEVNIYF